MTDLYEDVKDGLLLLTLLDVLGGHSLVRLSPPLYLVSLAVQDDLN